MGRRQRRASAQAQPWWRPKGFAAALAAVAIAAVVVAGGMIVLGDGGNTRQAADSRPSPSSPTPGAGNAAGGVEVVRPGATARLGPTAAPPTPGLARRSSQELTGTDYAGPDNTGYQHAPGYPGTLTDCSKTAIRSNHTYKFCDFPDGLAIGTSSITLTNVTFIGCRFADNAVEDADVADYSDNVRFLYDTFEPSTVSTAAEPVDADTPAIAQSAGYEYGIDQRDQGQLTVDHSDFWGFAAGVEFIYSSQAKPVTITHSWFHNPRYPGPVNSSNLDHTDGILNSDGGIGYITISGNTIVGDGDTQAIALQGSDAYDHVSVTGNYLSGYGYMVCIGAHTKDTSVVFTGNVWSSEFEPQWGPIYDDVNFVTANLGNIWRDNTYHVALGTTWLAKGNNGLFWWPDDAAASGQATISRSQIIGHSSDYTGP